MTGVISAADVPPFVAARRVFSAGGVVFTVADLARHAADAPVPAAPGALRPESVEEGFRRARGLLRGEQLEAWLASWSVNPEDFRAWTHDVATGTATSTRWCRLLCSGAFDQVTAELVAAVASASELGDPPLDPTTFDPAGWTARLCAQVTTPQALQEAIRSHRLEWTRFQLVLASTTERAVAEEIRHQARDAGGALGVVAARAGLEVREVSDVLGALAAGPVRSALQGARAGDLVGPVRDEDRWTVAVVVQRVEATLEDLATRGRAEAAVRTDAIGRAVARHVVA